MENGDGKDAVYKDGMVWGSKENGPIPSPPEGFSLYTRESGIVILKRRKQRNLQKLGKTKYLIIFLFLLPTH